MIGCICFFASSRNCALHLVTLASLFIWLELSVRGARILLLYSCHKHINLVCLFAYCLWDIGNVLSISLLYKHLLFGHCLHIVCILFVGYRKCAVHFFTIIFLYFYLLKWFVLVHLTQINSFRCLYISYSNYSCAI